MCLHSSQIVLSSSDDRSKNVGKKHCTTQHAKIEWGILSEGVRNIFKHLSLVQK